MAFKIFEDHQEKMVLISKQNKIKDPSSSPLTDYDNDVSCRDSMSRGCEEYELDQWHQQTQPYNNDITFGCLIDACVKNGSIERAENIFNQILKASMSSDQNEATNLEKGSLAQIKPNTIIFTTMIKAYSKT